MSNKRVLVLALVTVMLLLCSCSKAEETSIELVWRDNEATQQISMSETNVTELDNEKENIFEQIYCDVVTSMYVDSVDTNWEYEYTNNMLLLREIKTGYSDEYKLLGIAEFYDGLLQVKSTMEQEKCLSEIAEIERQHLNDYRAIKTIADNRGYNGKLQLTMCNEKGLPYITITDGQIEYSKYMTYWQLYDQMKKMLKNAMRNYK